MEEKIWYLRTQDETFGPETRDRLLEWARLGRIQPGQEVSDDNVLWRRVEEVPFLDMRFSIDIGDGNPRGPFNRAAAEALLKSGRLPPTSTIVEVRGPFVEETAETASAEAPAADAPGSEAPVAEAPAVEAPVADEPPKVQDPELRTVEVVKEVIKEVRVEVPVEKIVEKIVEVEKPVEVIKEVIKEVPVEVEKVVVDETRVKELESQREDLNRRIDELNAKNAELNNSISELGGRLKDALDRSGKLQEQVTALEDELKRLPQAASEIADVQAAVFKILQDEAVDIATAIEKEKAEHAEAVSRHTARMDRLQARRTELMKRSGASLEDMTRRALVERPEDPRTASLRREHEELKRQHEKARIDAEARIRDLNAQISHYRSEATRSVKELKDAAQYQLESQQLREALARAEKDLLAERQKTEDLRRREQVGQKALMARIASLESPSIGLTTAGTASAGRQTKGIKFPEWMRFK